MKTLAALSLAVAANGQATVIEFTPGLLLNIAGELDGDGDVDDFAISPDGTMVAFVGRRLGDTADGAYIGPIGGGALTKISPSDAGEVDGFPSWTPDGSSVLVRYDKGAGNVGNQVYLLPADGSQIETQLTFSPTNDFDQQVSADGARLFFSDNRDTRALDPDFGFDSPDAVYTTSLSSPSMTPIRLTPETIAEIDTGSYAQVGSDVVFAGFASMAATPDNGTIEDRFYRVAADGSGSPVEIAVTNFPDPNDFVGDIDFMAVTPDGESIIFRGDLTSDGIDELYTLPIAGGEATPLLPQPSRADFDAGSFVISPDGTTIAFQGDFGENGAGALFVIPVTGGNPIQVSDDLTGLAHNADVAGGVGSIAFTPDSKSLIYRADGRTSNLNEMFIVSNPIPEPTSMAILLFAVSGLVVSRRR